MINLIYIILIAILAIHISKDAIEGYDIISNDYRPQIAQLQTYNEELRVRLEQEKPEVTGQVQSVKEKTNAIRQELNDLKENIIRTADKDEYQSGILKNRDNEKATPDVLLSNKRGNNLKTASQPTSRKWKVCLPVTRRKTRKQLYEHHSSNRQRFMGRGNVLASDCQCRYHHA